MSRWLFLTVFCAIPALGCGSSVGGAAGLANAPRLGGVTTADNRVNDVIANGDDACGVSAESGSVLRNRIPPCASWAPREPMASVVTPAASQSSVGLVQPWLNHFYVGWPCATTTSHGKSLLPASSTVASCSLP
jgi:hypothetical protein